MQNRTCRSRTKDTLCSNIRSAMMRSAFALALVATASGFSPTPRLAVRTPTAMPASTDVKMEMSTFKARRREKLR